MIFSDRGRKKINFFNNKDPMSYSPDGKYVKHFEIPSPTQFQPYDGSKQYSLEKSKPEGLFFDQDQKRKEHDKMKQEYYDYSQYMMTLGKQPKSQQQYHNDIMKLAARPSTRDLKQAKQKFYAQELQRQRFASQDQRVPITQKYIGVKDDEVQVMDLHKAQSQFSSPYKNVFGGSGDPIYDEYGNINANIRGISENLHNGNSLSYSPMRNNNKGVKGSRTTLGEGYFQDQKITNIKSQLKKQQQLQHQMQSEGKNIMDRIFERQEERQMNRLQRHNEYMKDMERQMQYDNNIFSSPLTQQDRMMRMADDYYSQQQQQHHHHNSDKKNQEKSIFQEMSDENQKRKKNRDNVMEKHNNDLQEQIELKKQQKKMQNEIEKIKEKKEEEKLQKEREEIRKQLDEDAKKRKKIIQDTDAENQKIIEQQKKLQKNQQKLQEKQNHLISEAIDLQNKLKTKTDVESSRRYSQPVIEIPKNTNSHNSHNSSQKQFSNGNNSPPLYTNYPLVMPQQEVIYPLNSPQFNEKKQKPSQYPQIPAVNPVQKLYDNQHKSPEEKQQNHNNEDITNLRMELQNQTYKIWSDLQKIKEDMTRNQKDSDDQQMNMLQSQEKLFTNEMAKIEHQMKEQKNEILESQRKALEQTQAANAAAEEKRAQEKREKKSRQSSKDFLKEAQDEMIMQLREQQKQLVDEHKRKIMEEKQKREEERKLKEEEKQKRNAEKQQHYTEKLIQDINVELKKKDMMEDMRFKILKNKIKELDKAQNNALFMKTALATMQQTPRTQADELNLLKKHVQTYHEGDNDFRNIPIIQQHFHHNTAGDQTYLTHRSPHSQESLNSSQHAGYQTERKGGQNVITQHFHYDQLSTPRRPHSSQQRKTRYNKQTNMVSSAIQTTPQNVQESGFQVDSKMFMKDLASLPEPACNKKRQCSRQKMAQSQLNYYNNQSPQMTLPLVKRRESIDFGNPNTAKTRRYTPVNNKQFNQTYHQGQNNTLSYIEDWNNKQIQNPNYQLDSYNNNHNMNDYLNSTLLASQSPLMVNKDQQSTKKYPHSQYQSAIQPTNKLRSSSLLTDGGLRQMDNLPATLLENSNVINQNLDILDAIVKASNHNRTKSSQKRSVNRYYALKQKELDKEQEYPENPYSPYENSPAEGMGTEYYTNGSQSPYYQYQKNNPQNGSQVANWNSHDYNNQNGNFAPAERVINQLGEILSDIKSGNLPSRREQID